MKKNVLVTGTGGRSVGAGILHSLLFADKEVAKRWNIIAADADSFAWGLYKTEQHVILPFANSIEYLPAVHKAIKDFDIHAIVPGTEPETVLFANRQDEFEKVHIICNRKELMLLMMNKEELVKSFQENGINYIETFRIEQKKMAFKKYDYPFILKRIIGTGGSRGLQIIITEDELNRSIEQIDNPENYCIQPYIGNADNEYTIGVLSDKDGKVADSIVLKRKLIGLSLLSSRKIGDISYDISTGYSQGFIIKHPEIQKFCENLAIKYNSVGPLNIQLRVHNGEFYVFDFHPRFSGTTPIRADVNFHEVDLLLQNHIYGKELTRIDYKFDVAAIRAFEHVIVPISKMS